MDRSLEQALNDLAFLTGQLMGTLHRIERDEEMLKYLVDRGYSKDGIRLIFIHLKVLAEVFYR